MRLLPAPAIMIVLAAATPALALQRTPQPANATVVVRVADVDRAPVRRARAHRRHRQPAHGSWSRVVITSGHPLSRFPGEIQYRYLPGTYCCCCRGW
jgi:hypothetical protein